MAHLLHWLTTHALRLRYARHAADGTACFERIDGAELGTTEFRMSDSMRLAGAAAPDFANTQPAYTHRPGPVRSSVRWRQAA